jgi:hypothetical protein
VSDSEGFEPNKVQVLKQLTEVVFFVEGGSGLGMEIYLKLFGVEWSGEVSFS